MSTLVAIEYDDPHKAQEGPAISKRIIESHSGRIDLGNAGAEFVITLPREVSCAYYSGQIILNTFGSRQKTLHLPDDLKLFNK